MEVSFISKCVCNWYETSNLFHFLLVVFFRWTFIANPDLAERFRNNVPSSQND